MATVGSLAGAKAPSESGEARGRRSSPARPSAGPRRRSRAAVRESSALVSATKRATLARSSAFTIWLAGIQSQGEGAGVLVAQPRIGADQLKAPVLVGEVFIQEEGEILGVLRAAVRTIQEGGATALACQLASYRRETNDLVAKA